MMYKLRFYVIGGWNEGYLDHEEYFSSIYEARERYLEVFDPDNMALNPTMWAYVDGNYIRIMGY